MRRFVTVGLAIAGTLTAGCKSQVFQVSVQPFFAASESPDGLAGRWLADDDESDGLELEPVAGGYRIHLFSDSTHPATSRKQYIGLARFGRVAGGLYWDLTSELPANADDVASEHLLRLHSLARVRLEGDALTVALLDPEWLAAALADGRVDLAHIRSGADDAPLLTASTDALVAFVEAHGDDPDAFRDVGGFHRGL
jgi:hypothetical protein